MSKLKIANPFKIGHNGLGWYIEQVGTNNYVHTDGKVRDWYRDEQTNVYFKSKPEAQLVLDKLVGKRKPKLALIVMRHENCVQAVQPFHKGENHVPSRASIWNRNLDKLQGRTVQRFVMVKKAGKEYMMDVPLRMSDLFIVAESDSPHSLYQRTFV